MKFETENVASLGRLVCFSVSDQLVPDIERIFIQLELLFFRKIFDRKTEMSSRYCRVNRFAWIVGNQSIRSYPGKRLSEPSCSHTGNESLEVFFLRRRKLTANARRFFHINFFLSLL